MDKDQHTFDIERVPLLLAYPTALLAANLVTHDTTRSVLGLLLSLVAVPLFLASVITLIYTQMDTGSTTTSRSKSKGLLASQRTLKPLIGLMIASSTLGTIRAVVISLVLIINVHYPFLIASVLFDIASLYYKQKLFILPSSLQDIDLYTVLLGYLALFLVKDGLREIDQVQRSDSLTVPLITMTLSALTLGYNYTQLHSSMLLVTVASAVVLNVSQIDSEGINFRQGSPTVVGFIAVLLEILSFSSDFINNKVLAIGEVMLVAATAFITVNDDLFKLRTTQIKPKDEPLEEISILQQLFLHEDTKAIFSYLMLNTIFMFVQFLYSFRSKSLGLLSDSLHMALDCTSLALGLIAGVLAKRPASQDFPFGLARIETLAGFANGVLLVGIVAGIVMEAIERILNPVTLEKTGELLVVSFLGFVVNIIGIFAFNHGSAHGHGHSHGHSHSHGSDDHMDNENMKGIFLHILADTLGSAGVVVSTILTSVFNNNIFDPIASLFIAIMIFVSALPLIKSSASNLLLSLDDKKEEVVRDILSQISTTPGVVGYTAPRFWVSSDILTSSIKSDHGHSHSVEVEHSHGHEHKHEHKHEHSHGHSTTHQQDHEEHKHTEETCTTPDLVGYIHIQYLDGENSTIIKKRVQKIFENHNTRAAIQVEAESSSCWCRKSV